MSVVPGNGIFSAISANFRKLVIHSLYNVGGFQFAFEEDNFCQRVEVEKVIASSAAEKNAS